MLGGFLAALPCGEEIEERLHWTRAGNAWGWMHSIKEHTLV
jgi:hypothetical protein